MAADRDRVPSGLVLRDLHKSFGDVHAVRGVDLDVPRGAFVTLLGPSGCGKTTTLNIAAGLESSDRGSVWVDSEDVTDHPPHLRGMAMVFQSYALYPHKNVYGNLAFSLRLQRLDRSTIEDRVHAVARLLEIEPLLDRRVGQLSGGQQQRVSLARALVKEPRVFLFDEPLSNLDAALRVRTRKEIKKLHLRLGATSLFVTHDQEEAMALSDLIAVMRDGVIVQFGTPDEIYLRPVDTYVAEFVGSPRISMLRTQMSLESDRLRFTVGDGAEVFTLPHDAVELNNGWDGAQREIVLGARSEDIEVTERPLEDTITCEVELVDPMGPDTYLSMSLGGSEIVARVGASIRPEPGSLVHIRFLAERVHIFDRLDGHRINRSEHHSQARVHGADSHQGDA